MTSPLITIAIPAYKHEFIEDAIKSALTQDYDNIEVIVVDDNSPYDILSVMNKFHDNRLSYYRNAANLGKGDPTANWNECLKHAKGEYICILCDDDKYDETYVSTMVSLANTYKDCNVFRSGIKVIDSENKVTDLYPLAPSYENVYEYIWHLHSGNNRQTISEWMIKRDALTKIGGYVSCPMAWGSDCCTIFTLAERGGVASSPLRLVSFRNGGGNITGAEYSHIPEKYLGWSMQCDTAKAIIERGDYAYKDVVLHEIERDRRVWYKMYIKHASIKDLTYMRRHKDLYKLSTGAYLNGIIRNLLWMSGLRKKEYNY